MRVLVLAWARQVDNFSKESPERLAFESAVRGGGYQPHVLPRGRDARDNCSCTPAVTPPAAPAN